MNSLNLENIKKQAPYEITLVEEAPCILYFKTDYEVEYEIIIKPNDMFIPSGAYALDIINIWGNKSPGDSKFRQTLIAIVEEFFRRNNDVMLYVTETKDRKQAFRNRLFVRWFNTYAQHDQYIIKTAEGKMKGQMNFMAIIMRKDNTRKDLAIKEFEETVDFLFDKLIMT